MDRVLVAYTTNSGSTEDVARLIAEELGKGGAAVDYLRLEDVASLEPYSAVVIGAPMIMGWHKAALKFLKQHAEDLRDKRLAYFMMAMSLTQTEDTQIDGVPLFIDPALPAVPKKAGHLSFREGYATPKKYVRPVLKATPALKPLSVAIFGGSLALYRLKLLQMLFVMLIVRAQAGEKRNYPAIRQWAADLRWQLSAGDGHI
jgi:menaquinone-dependent protoporphyrinogen IX oxidase